MNAERSILAIAQFAAFADGRMSEAVRAFLSRLKTLPQLDAGEASRAEGEVDAIVSLAAAGVLVHSFNWPGTCFSRN